MSSLKYVAVGSAFLSAFLVVRALQSVPTRETPRLGLRGKRRAEDMGGNGVLRVIDPLVRWLSARIGPLMGETLHQKIGRRLVLAGEFCGYCAEEYIALVLLCAAAGVASGSMVHLLLHKGAAWMFVPPIVGAACPMLRMSAATDRRRREVHDSLPWVIDLLALSLGAGLDFPGALSLVVEKRSNSRDALTEEVAHMLNELQTGKTRKYALLQLAQRVPTESVKEFVAAIVQAEERGNPLGKVLQAQAEISRHRRSVRAEETSAKVGAKMVLPMMLLFAAILLLITGPLMLQVGDAFGN